MKYLITESKLEKVATDYINELFPEDNLHLKYIIDNDGEIEAMKVYLGNPDDDSICFRWYSAEYFVRGTSHREKSPMVAFDDKYLFSVSLSYTLLLNNVGIIFLLCGSSDNIFL